MTSEKTYPEMWIQMLKGKPSLDTDPMLVKFHLSIYENMKVVDGVNCIQENEQRFQEKLVL